MSERDYQYKVCTRCFTFNHAAYIKDSLSGFTMQETTFPAVFVIVDDASIDGEQEVIRQFLFDHFHEPYYQEETDSAHIICARHRSNVFCEFVVVLLKYNHYSINKPKMGYLSKWLDNAQYHAICEGDDYWVHPKKLQMQVDYLDMHPKVGLVYTEVDRLFQSNHFIEKGLFESSPIKNTHEDFLLYSWFLAPCTWAYRGELSSLIPELDNKKFFTGDTLLLLTLSKYSQVCFINQVTAVYRVLDKSASHFIRYKQKRLFYRKNINTRAYFVKDYNKCFRIKFWWKCFIHGRPSLQRQLIYYPEWLLYGFVSFFKIVVL